MIIRMLIFLILSLYLYSCGKVGPLNLPEDKIDKSVITYPCDKTCLQKIEDEKIRQQSVILQTD